MATDSARIEARIFGRDQEISGPLRFTLPNSFATDLLMPMLVQFRASYPAIALELISSGSVLNLGNREADVALRVVIGGGSPPENLYGSPLCGFHMGHYMFRDPGDGVTIALLLGANEAVPTDWRPAAALEMATVQIRFPEMRAQ